MADRKSFADMERDAVLTKICKACGANKPTTEFNKNPRSGDRLQRLCKPCHREQSRSYRPPKREPRSIEETIILRREQRARYAKEHIEHIRRYRKEYAIRNRARLKSEKHESYLKNRKRIQEATKLTAQMNPERTRSYKRKWERNNPGKANAKTARRYASKTKATPAWADIECIAEFYDLAARRTRATGIRWDVDHIVPLRSAQVCGLHVEHNLRVIPMRQNQSKGNRYWPDMPEAA